MVSAENFQIFQPWDDFSDLYWKFSYSFWKWLNTYIFCPFYTYIYFDTGEQALTFLWMSVYYVSGRLYSCLWMELSASSQYLFFNSRCTNCRIIQGLWVHRLPKSKLVIPSRVLLGREQISLGVSNQWKIKIM